MEEVVIPALTDQQIAFADAARAELLKDAVKGILIPEIVCLFQLGPEVTMINILVQTVGNASQFAQQLGFSSMSVSRWRRGLVKDSEREKIRTLFRESRISNDKSDFRNVALLNGERIAIGFALHLLNANPESDENPSKFKKRFRPLSASDAVYVREAVNLKWSPSNPVYPTTEPYRHVLPDANPKAIQDLVDEAGLACLVAKREILLQVESHDDE